MTSEPYKVSICIPVYGVERYIERRKKSLFEQTYNNIEFLFIDDYSIDHSIEMLHKVMDEFPDRKKQVHIIKHTHNRGLAAARNTALEAATGEFLMHVDSDDWIEVNAIEELVRKQMEDDADFVTSDIHVISRYKNYNIVRSQQKTSRELSLSLIRRDIEVCIWGQLIRTSLYRQNNIRIEEGVNVGEDFQQTPRLAYYAKTIACLKKPIYHYDCTNNMSYMHSGFSLSKWKEDLRSRQIIIDFCQDKGKDYVAAAEYLRFITAAESLRDLTKSQICHKEYHEMLSIVNSHRDLWNTQPFYLRICFYLQNIYLVAFLIRTARFMKRLCLRIYSCVNKRSGYFR